MQLHKQLDPRLLKVKIVRIKKSGFHWVDTRLNMIYNQESSIAEFKEALLQLNVSKSDANADGIPDAQKFLLSCFNNLFGPFQSGSISGRGNDSLLLLDTFSLWLSRSIKLTTSGNCDTAFVETLRDDLLTMENNTILFRSVTDLMGSSSGPLRNALDDFLAKLLRMIKLLYSSEQYVHFLDQLLGEILQLPPTLRVRYTLIHILVRDIDMFRIFDLEPEFVRNFLSLISQEPLSNLIGKCLTKVLVNIFRIHFGGMLTAIDEWMEFWSQPALFYLEQDMYRKPVTSYFLIPLFQDMPSEAFNKFINRTDFTDRPGLLIPVLKIAEHLSMEDLLLADNMLTPLETMSSLLANDTFKLDTFEVLTFSSQKSKPIPEIVFDMAKKNLIVFFVETEVKTRNQFASSFNAFIKRIGDSGYTINKKLRSLQRANKFPREQHDLAQTLHLYKGFLEWLFVFLKTQMVPGIWYHRVLLAFSILQTLIESGLGSSVPNMSTSEGKLTAPYLGLDIVSDKCLLRLLVDNLSNDVPSVRQAATNLLHVIFNLSGAAHSLRKIDQNYLKKVSSIYMGGYQSSDIGASIKAFSFYISGHKSAQMNEELATLEKAITRVKSDSIANSKNSLAVHLSNLNLFLTEEQDKEIKISLGEEAIIHVLSHLDDIWDLAKDILCSDPFEISASEKCLNSGISEQVMSSYAYRSVSELASLLETFLKNYNLSVEQVTTIGNFCIELLSTIRHSGAFQSVLPCFEACCMKCAELCPHQLDTWLNDTLSSLEYKTRTVIRRSGGVPFLIVGILKAKQNKTDAFLGDVFSRLLEIAKLPASDAQEHLDMPQVNAFNCIKAIFTDSTLSEFCSPLISPVLTLAIDNFRSEKWPIRNCSLMLFTALQNRIFNRAGKGITDRIFFTKYEGLEVKLLDILCQCNNASAAVSNKILGNDKRSVFLVLSVLSHLKSLSGSDRLLAFKDEVQRYLGNEDWKIREMAAKTLSCLSNSPIHDSTQLMATCTTSDENRLHGSLLAVRYMINAENFKVYSPDSKSLASFRDLLFKSCGDLLLNKECYVTCSEYLNVLDSFLHIRGSEVDSELLNLLGNAFLQHYSSPSLDSTKQIFLSKLLRLLLKHEAEENLVILFQLGLESDLYEVQSAALEFGVDGLNLSLLEESDRCSTGSRVEYLLFDRETLPLIKSQCLKFLQRLQTGLSFERLVNIIHSEKSSRSLHLTALETLGKYVPKEKTNEFLDILETFADESADCDYREAAAKSLMDFTDRYLDVGALLRLHKQLYDDDEGVRRLVARHINKYLLKKPDWDVNCNVLKTAHSMLKQFTRLFTAPEISGVLTQEIIRYLGKFDNFKARNIEQSDVLFEVEKDNQYRNDVEVYIQYIQLLGDLTPCDTSQLKEFTKKLYAELRCYILEEETRDSILGWLSDADTFTRVLILRKLVETLTPEVSGELWELLREAQAHPLILQYELLGV